MDFDTRLKVAWALTLLALAVAAGELAPSQGAVVLCLVLALSAVTIWLRGHMSRAFWIEYEQDGTGATCESRATYGKLRSLEG